MLGTILLRLLVIFIIIAFIGHAVDPETWKDAWKSKK